MAEFLFPSSYRCDCGHESHFSENTVRSLIRMSLRKRQYLADSETDEHTIEFSHGRAVAVSDALSRSPVHAWGDAKFCSDRVSSAHKRNSS